MRTYLNLFLLFFTMTSFSQTCDTVDLSKKPYLEQQFKKYGKKLSRLKPSYAVKADIFFEVATYLRQKNDTNSKKWYEATIELYKHSYHHGRHDIRIKGERIYRTGLCYFYLGNDDEAVTFFSKSIAAKYPSPCPYYFISLIKRKQGKDEEAKEEYDAFLKRVTKERPMDQFISVNARIEASNQNFMKRCALFIDSVAPGNRQKAYEFHLASDSLYDFIENMKHAIIAGIYDSTAAKPAGFGPLDLKKRIGDHRNMVKQRFGDLDIKKYEELLTVENIEEGGRSIPWEEYNFVKLPIAGVITNLSKMQADVKNLEGAVLDQLRQ